jgi:hypothetical protein
MCALFLGHVKNRQRPGELSRLTPAAGGLWLIQFPRNPSVRMVEANVASRMPSGSTGGLLSCDRIVFDPVASLDLDELRPRLRAIETGCWRVGEPQPPTNVLTLPSLRARQYSTGCRTTDYDLLPSDLLTIRSEAARPAHIRPRSPNPTVLPPVCGIAGS